MRNDGGLDLAWIEGRYSIAQLPPGSEVPAPRPGPFGSVTSTPDELSIVCPVGEEPAGATIGGPYAALRIVGAMSLSLTGVLVRILLPLAEERIPVFTIATFDTDYVLVPVGEREQTESALSRAGHRFVGADSGIEGSR